MEKRVYSGSMTPAQRRKRKQLRNLSGIDKIRYAIFMSSYRETIECACAAISVLAFTVGTALGLFIMHKDLFVAGIAIVLTGLAIFCAIGEVIFNPWDDEED